MKIVVTYKSKTGFTKKYAEIIKNNIDCEAIPFEEMSKDKMSNYDVVVYGGGTYAGSINGFKKVRKMFKKSSAKKLVVFLTGGAPNEANKENLKIVWERNLKDDINNIPHFYMQGGICYEKMSSFNRKLMKMFAAMMDKKDDKTEEEKEFLEYLRKSYDISDEKYVMTLIEYLNSLTD